MIFIFCIHRHPKTIRNLCAKFNQTGSIRDIKQRSRSRVVTIVAVAQELQCSVRLGTAFVIIYTIYSGTPTARQTIRIQQRPVSYNIIRRRLATNNLACCRPAKGVILTPRHRQKRLQWATDRRNWRHQQQKNIILDPFYPTSCSVPLF